MSANKRTYRVRGGTALLAAGLLALTACAGGGGSEKAASSASGTRHLNIASATSSLSAGPILAAISLDTFRREGLEIKYTDFAGSSPNTVAAVTSGAADVGLVGAATGWDAIQQGAPLVIVAAIAGNTSELGMRSDVAQRLGISERSPIADRVAALKGLKIATAQTGSANNQMIRSLLTLYHLNPDKDVTIVPSEPTAIVAGLQNKAFDAAFYGTGVMEQNYADKTAVPLISLPRGDVSKLNDIVFAFAIAREDTVKKNPDLIDRFVHSLRDAGTQIKQNDSATRDAVKKQYFPDLPQNVFDLSWDQVKPAWLLDGKLTQQQLKASLDFQSKTTGKTYDNVTFDKDVAATARA